MLLHDTSNRDRETWSRLRLFVDRTNGSDDERERPGLASCKHPPTLTPAASPYAADGDDDDDDAPITIRWALG